MSIHTDITGNNLGEPKISVVVTTYNRAALLIETLRSIKDQTVPVDEIVVINDGGSDDTEERVRALDSKILYLYQPNAGMQAARNHGIKYSNYEWIAFSDDDDLWMPNRCEKIKSLIKSYPVDIVASNFQVFSEQGIIIPSFFDRHKRLHPELWDWFFQIKGSSYMISKCIPPTALLPESPFWGALLVVRRSAIEEISGWDQSVNKIPSEDLHFVYRVLRGRSIGAIMEPTLKYRSHSGNVSRDNTKKYLGRIEIVSRLIDTVSDEVEKEHLLQFVKRGLYEVFWSQVNSGDLTAATSTAKRIGIRNLGVRSMAKFLLALPKFLLRNLFSR